MAAAITGACSLRGSFSAFPNRDISLRQIHQLRCHGLSLRKRRVRVSAGTDAEDEDLQARIQQADWRAFRARLVQKSACLDDVPAVAAADATISADSVTPELWAHSIPRPETGCLVIANPTEFSVHQQYFNQAVIFLFAHTIEGSAGLILNRPTEYNLGQLAGFEELLPDFANCALYMGGDVGVNALHVVHGVQGLEDSVEIIPGVYMGGLKAMKESVQRGESKPEQYRWFARYAGWGPGQLEREVSHGVWYLASCSKDIIMKPCLNLPKPLWREVLEYMGNPYIDISRRTYGEI
ncbi:hypothetical protein KP509_37G051900 [Ceratopteris richardii]|uniref:Uncharacterized protein n=1 Tax=Ceratopteris richardii TaxID=49495 RepID=A0A8T2Q7R3_CERRI|nr:hypothetical protein KP509_37G051900 [Ceratopteris richardii]